MRNRNRDGSRTRYCTMSCVSTMFSTPVSIKASAGTRPRSVRKPTSMRRMACTFYDIDGLDRVREVVIQTRRALADFTPELADDPLLARVDHVDAGREPERDDRQQRKQPCGTQNTPRATGKSFSGPPEFCL
jgi:hypothetical protein